MSGTEYDGNPRVWMASSKVEGGCNGCTGHTDALGSHEHAVYVVDLRTLSVRLCDLCTRKLLAALTLAGTLSRRQPKRRRKS